MKKRILMLLIIVFSFCMLSLNGFANQNLEITNFIVLSTSSIQISDFTVPLILAAIVALIISLVITGSMKAKMNTARKKTQAQNYIRQGSFRLDQSYDRFTKEYTEREEKPKQKK